jgi:prevent-host-death family protein
MGTWGLAEAKARLSTLVEKALVEGPQEITKNGKQAVTLIATSQLEELRRPRESMADFLMKSPLRGSGIKIGRVNLRARKVEL